MRPRSVTLAAASAAALALAATLIAAAPALAVPFSIATTPSVTPSSSVNPTTTTEVNAARARVLDLEKQISALQDESVAISERIAVTSLRIYLQQREVDAATIRLQKAKNAYANRLVALYKGYATPLTLLLESRDFSDFITRVTWLSRLTDIDRRIYEDAVIETAEANFQASQLDDFRAQDVELRRLQEERLAQSRLLLAEQEQLVLTLDEASKAALAEARKLTADERKRWMDSSIPLTEKVAIRSATVSPYPYDWKVAYYQPKSYKATGVRFTAVCSWYGNEFHGRRTASGQIYNQEDLTCASKTLPFGTRLALTRGDRRIIVVVTDRGPFIAGRDLDLSRAAARLLGFTGVEPVEVEIVDPVR